MVPQARPVGPAFIKHQRFVALRVWSKKTHRQSGQAFKRGQVPIGDRVHHGCEQTGGPRAVVPPAEPVGSGRRRKSSRSIQRPRRRAADFGSSTAPRKSSRSARNRASFGWSGA